MNDTNLENLSKEELIALLQKTRNELQQNKQDLQAKHQELEQKLDKANKDLNKTTNDLKQSQKELVQSKKELHKTTKHLQKSTQQLAKTQHNLEQKTAKLGRSVKVIQALQQENRNLFDKNKKLQEDNKKLKLFKDGTQDIIQNMQVYMKDNLRVYHSLLESYPKDSYDLVELNTFLQELLYEHTKSAHLLTNYVSKIFAGSTSEKNKGASSSPGHKHNPNNNNSLSNSCTSANTNNSSEPSFDESKEAEGTFEDDNLKASEYPYITEEDKANAIQTDNCIANQDINNNDKTENQLLQQLVNITEKYCTIRHNQKLNQGVVPTVEDRKILTAQNIEQVNTVIKSSGYINYFCPKCNEIHKFKVDSRVLRVNEILTIENSKAKKVLCAVQNITCPKCGCNVELNPASLVQFNLFWDPLKVANKTMPNFSKDKDKNALYASSKQSINSNIIDNKDNFSEKSATLYEEYTSSIQDKNSLKDKNKELKAKIREITHSDTVVKSIFDLEKYLLPNNVIDPKKIDLSDLMHLPIFSKSKLSVGICVAAACYFSHLTAPKNRITSLMNAIGLDFSRVQITNIINSFARGYLYPITKQIHKDILANNQAIIMDETTLKVRDTKTKNGENIKKSYIWCMVSGWTELIKAAWFTPTDTRSHVNVIDILRTNEDFKVKFLTTDAYSGYACALEKLREQGIDIAHSSCITHARRPLHYYLKNSGLLEIYNKYLLPNGSKFTDFKDNILKYNDEHQDNKLSQLNIDALILYYFINTLFVIDAAVVFDVNLQGDKELFLKELAHARETASAAVVDSIYKLIALMIKNNPGIVDIVKNENDEVVKYKNNKFHPLSGALIYLLNVQQNMQVFLKEPRVELTSSAAFYELIENTNIYEITPPIAA